MYHHIKKLMYTVRVGTPDPKFGNMLLEQFGGANGELAAAMRYFTQGLAEIAWDDITEYAPAVVAAVAMPLTYSIATGIGLGFITYALAKIVAGKFKEATPTVLLLAALFAAKFALPE